MRRPMRAVQMLAFCALQRMFHASESNQMYFAAQTTQVRRMNQVRMLKRGDAASKLGT